MPLEAFARSDPLSLGVELELQLLSPRDLDLTRGAPRLLAHLAERDHAGHVHPEVTEGMIEVNTGVHDGLPSLLAELRRIRNDLAAAAQVLDISVSGGGSHPFQHWAERSISQTPRHRFLSELYGYLSKQYTVFGQHVHVGCTDGEEALYLLHCLSRYVPHMVALAAGSPFAQGADTMFDCSRLNYSLAFPLAGQMPCLLAWRDFATYYGKLERLGIVGSMSDVYWDIRPKPGFGTIEVRVCDTPLTVERAAVLAAFIQALSRYLLHSERRPPSEDDYLVYSYNRFTACRFGLGASYIDPLTLRHEPLQEHVLRTLDEIAPHAAALEAEAMPGYLRSLVEHAGNDAGWIRSRHSELGSFEALMREQAHRWLEDDPLLPR